MSTPVKAEALPLHRRSQRQPHRLLRCLRLPLPLPLPLPLSSSPPLCPLRCPLCCPPETVAPMTRCLASCPPLCAPGTLLRAGDGWQRWPAAALDCRCPPLSSPAWSASSSPFPSPPCPSAPFASTPTSSSTSPLTAPSRRTQRCAPPTRSCALRSTHRSSGRHCPHRSTRQRRQRQRRPWTPRLPRRRSSALSTQP